MNSNQTLCHEVVKRFLAGLGESEQFIIPSVGNLVLNVVLMLTASVGNALISFAILTSQDLQTPSYLLITSLAFTDLLVGVVYHPLQIALMTYILDNNVSGICQVIPVYTFVVTFLCVLSFLMVAFISIDRNLALNLRQRYRLTVTKRRVRLVILLGWMLSLPFGFISIFLRYQAYVPTLMFFLGLVLFSTCCFYIHAYTALRRACRRVHSRQPHQVQLNNLNIQKYRKTFKTMVSVLVCLLLCFVPFICSLVAIVSYGGSFPTIMCAFASLTLLALHSSVSPVVYIISFRDIRHRIRQRILGHHGQQWNHHT